MEYEYDGYVFNNMDNRSVLYKDGRLLFMGNSWSGIMQFLNFTNHAPEVKEMFRAQLEQREVVKLRAEAKKPKDPEPPVVQEPKKKPVLRRPSMDRRLV